MLPKIRLKDNKAVALIIVIFAMMIFAVLGWTLTVMQSTDFEANLRNFDSERTLDLAEAGAQWGFQSLKTDFDCSNFNPTGSPPGILHSLGAGQYRVSCDCTVGSPQCNNSTQLILQSTGYIPSELIFRAQRQIRVVVDQGAFATAGTVKTLFDWAGMTSGAIDGKLQAECFDGPDAGSSCPGTDGVDYGTNLPPGTGQRIQDTTTLPPINMGNFKSKAQGYNRYRNYTQTAVVADSSNDDTLRLTAASPGIFSNITNSELTNQTVAVRVVGDAGYQWPNNNSWVYITARTNNRRVTVALKPNTVPELDMSDWRGKTVKLVKRFYGNLNNDTLWYVQGSDIIVDARTAAQDGPAANANFQKTSFIAEGDFLIKGARNVRMSAFVDTSNNETFPNLATQNGNIYSNDTPNNGGAGRKFDGLIYTYNGNVEFNCINGVAIMGNNVKVYGEVDLEYDAKYVDTDGFFGSISKISWQEQ